MRYNNAEKYSEYAAFLMAIFMCMLSLAIIIIFVFICFLFAEGPSEQSVSIMLNGEESELCFHELKSSKVSKFFSGFLESSIKVI